MVSTKNVVCFKLPSELSPIPNPGPCYYNNGGCSYLCLATGMNERVCACPDELQDCQLQGNACLRLRGREVGGVGREEREYVQMGGGSITYTECC